MPPGYKVVPRRTSATGAELVAYTELKATVLSMKRDNRPNTEIAKALGVSNATITRLIPRIFREMLMDAGAAEVRVMELMRMEHMTQRMWKKFDDEEWVPDDKFVHAYLAISKRKADLVGADAPKKVDVDLAVTSLGGDDTASPSLALANKVERFMDLADKILQAGIGSGRAEPEPKELLPGNNPDGTPRDPNANPDDEVVDGEIVTGAEGEEGYRAPEVSDEGVEWVDDMKGETQDEIEDDGLAPRQTTDELEYDPS